MTPNKPSRRTFWSLFDRNHRTMQPRPAGCRRKSPWRFGRSLPLALEQLETRVVPSAVSTDKPDYAPGETAVITGTSFQVGPWIILFPGIFLAATVLAINLVGDGLRDLLDPRIARRL